MGVGGVNLVCEAHVFHLIPLNNMICLSVFLRAGLSAVIECCLVQEEARSFNCYSPLLPKGAIFVCVLSASLCIHLVNDIYG